MLRKHFEPYTELVLNCITSCTTEAHAHCCRDMIYRFAEMFKACVEPVELDKTLTIMNAELAQKCNELN